MASLFGLPKFQCWIEGYNSEDDPEDLQEIDAEEAAKTYAEKYHDGGAEYPECTEVFVKDKNGKTIKFKVTWEAVREYHAEEL